MPYCDKSETSELQYLKKLSEVILVKCTQHYITCTDIWFHSSFKIDYRLCIYVLVSLSIRYSHALCTYRHSLCFFSAHLSVSQTVQCGGGHHPSVL